VWTQNHGIELRRGFHRHVALPHVLADLLDRSCQRVAVAAATAGTDLERVAGLELRHQNLGIGKVALPFSGNAQLHRITRAVEPAIEPPRPAMRSLALAVDHHIRAPASHPLDAQAAAAPAGTAGT